MMRSNISLLIVGGLSLVVVLMWTGLSVAQTTILDDHFTGASVDANTWNIDDAGANNVVAISGGTNLLVQNVDSGSGFWGGGIGVWNKGNNLSEPLFERPTGSDEVNAYFFGVDMNSVMQRVAFGLSSFNEWREETLCFRIN